MKRLILCGVCVAVCVATASVSTSAEEPAITGWRGDGSGRYPSAQPPIQWGRTSAGLQGVRWQAEKPKDDAAAGQSLEEGVVRRWLVLGPVAPPAPAQPAAEGIQDESQWRPTEGDKVGAASWKPADAEGAFLNFNSLLGKSETAVAYAHAYLYSPEERELVCGLLHSPDCVVYLNGKVACRRPPGQGIAGWTRLSLAKGWNSLLARIRAGKDSWKNMWSLNAVFYGGLGEYQSQNIAWRLPWGGGAAPIIVGQRLLFQSEPYDLVCLDKDSGKVLWVRSNNYFEATAAPDRKGPAFDETASLAAELNRLNDSLAGSTALTAEQPAAKTKIQKQLYDVLRKVDEKKYTFTKEQDLGMSGFVPVSDGRRVWAWFGSGIAACYDLDGKRQWIALDNRAGTHHGYATSPALVGTTLVAYMHELIGFDAETGKQVWVQPICPNPRDHWACSFQGSLCPLRIAGRPLFMTAYCGSMRRAEDGKEVFADRSMAGSFQTPTPVAQGNMVYKQDTNGTLHILELPDRMDGDLKPLAHRQVKLDTGAYRMFYQDWHMASPLVHDRLVYGVNMSGLFSVFDAEAGQVVYQRLLDLDIHQGWGLLRPSICLAGRHLFVLGPTGTCLVLEPGREFKQVAKNRIAALSLQHGAPCLERFTATPVFDGPRIYLRGERDLYCIRAASGL